MGDADDRLGEILGGVADPVQVGARGGALGPLGEGAAAVLEVEGWHGGCSRGARHYRPSFAIARRRSRSQRASRARSRRTRSGSTWRPGRCMFASPIRRRSSAVSAIHLASTSSESGSRALPYGRGWSGNATQYSLSSSPVCGHVGDDRLVRVDQVGVGRVPAPPGARPSAAPHAQEPEVAVHLPVLLVDARAQQRAGALLGAPFAAGVIAARARCARRARPTARGRA